jgi:hypothetical protein
METIRLKIDDAHSLDIIDGGTLDEQPLETQEAWQQYITDTGFNPYWKVKATTFDNFNRPLTWHYELGELIVDLVVTYRYPKNKKNWTWETTVFTFIANINKD